MSKCYLLNVFAIKDDFIVDSCYDKKCFSSRKKALEQARKIGEEIAERIAKDDDEGNTFCHLRYSKRTPEKASSGSWEIECDWTEADIVCVCDTYESEDFSYEIIIEEYDLDEEEE